MEFGSIQREIQIDAPPDVVFDVVSRPEHLKEWWPDDARYQLQEGSAGEIVFGDPNAGGMAVAFTVLEVQPPRTFTFRWTQPSGGPAAAGNSLLVTFELTPTGRGTLLRMTESGFREMGWETAVLEQQYREHVTGWDFYLPRIAPYVARLEARR
ncbi:MAG TPA: SRPBCC family protein [Marmoricola sp.]|nr:SRPBCC family protein [Marmoricola sp.]